MNDTKTRLAIAGRIAAGMCAHPRAFDRGTWETEVANSAWNIAGRLQRMAADHEAQGAPEAIAANAAAYAKARG